MLQHFKTKYKTIATLIVLNNEKSSVMQIPGFSKMVEKATIKTKMTPCNVEQK